MRHFYFTRHGETVWNVENKICGTTDIGLTEKGIRQAHELAEKIKAEGMHIDCILCSPLIRARETARIIAEETGIELQVENRLNEQCFGIWEGTARNGKEFHEAKTHFIDSYKTGETMLKLAHRIYGLIDEITAQDDKVYLLVAHNGISRVVQSYFHDLSNEEYSAFGIKNCEIVKYEY